MSFSLRIATPALDVFSGTVDYVSLNTPDGRAGFLRGALPRVAVLSAGPIEITVGDEKIKFYGADGIYSITDGGMTIITSTCHDSEKPQQDIERVDDGAGLREKYAKARIASSLIKMKGNKFPEETF